MRRPLADERDLLLRVRAEKERLVDFLGPHERLHSWLGVSELQEDERAYARYRAFWLREMDEFSAALRRRWPADPQVLQGERALRSLFEVAHLGDAVVNLPDRSGFPTLDAASAAIDAALDRYAAALDDAEHGAAGAPRRASVPAAGLAFAAALLVVGFVAVSMFRAAPRETGSPEIPAVAAASATPQAAPPASPLTPSDAPGARARAPATVVLAHDSERPCAIDLPTSGAQVAPPSDLLAFLAQANLLDFDVLADATLIALPLAEAEREARARVAALWVGQAQDCLWSSSIRPYVVGGVHEDPQRRDEVGATVTCVVPHGDASWWVYSPNEPWPMTGISRTGQPIALRGFTDQTYVVERTADGSYYVVGWAPVMPPACR